MNENQSKTTQIITQESLQPQRIRKEDKAYQSVLDIEERLQKGDATNIALTGPYGSGKSSILITLEEDFPKHHYLNISLATLKPSEATVDKGNNEKNDGGKGDEISKLNLDRLIEYSILQQLLYKEKQEVLPNSRFKRIFHLTGKKVCQITVAIILAIMATIILFEPSFLRVEWLCNLFGKEWINMAGDSVCIFYLLWFTYKAVAMIVPAVSNSRLNKLNLKDGEIEIVENTSIFNKHLDEILYFFEKTDYDIVMLEDLDRFDSTDIFLKLRELNLLLNESKVIERKIIFIYAVRDDMFQDNERVKCFDYITTVIPVINRSNAKDKLKEELKKRGVSEIPDSHLQKLGFFLYDMRLLKNIANEYVQYREKVSKGISSERLLGMIVYKNYFPKDFADLHDCKGIVYQLLNLKETFIAARIEELEEYNNSKRDLKERHLKERHLKEHELRRIYLDEYRDRLGPTLQKIKIGENSYGLKDIAANEKLFERLISDVTVQYTYLETSGYYGGRSLQNTVSISFSDVEQSIDATTTYHERLGALRATFNELEEALLVDIRKEDIRSQTLSQIMNGMDYVSNDAFMSLKVPKLIEFLVVEGYLDENYYDYISYFYGNFIDAHDWDYVLDLKLGRTHPYDYPINNIEACIKEIPNTVYRKNAILNIALLDFLASHSSDRLSLGRMLVMLRTAMEGGKYDFLAEYYQKGRQQDVVFAQLFDQHKNLWDAFEKNDDDKQSLKLSWFKYAEIEQSCEASQKWLSRHFDFITNHLLDIEDESWGLLIRKGRYEFSELNVISRDILKAVADTNSYVLSRHNVEILVGYLLDMNLDSVSYRLVAETDQEVLIEHIQENLGLCLKSVFAVPEAEKESEDAIFAILYSTQATDDEKICYLQKQQNKIDLEAIEQNDVKTLALRSDIVDPNWENVIHYLNNVSEREADSDLVAFIENHVDQLSAQTVPQESKEDETMLLGQFVASDVLAFNTYERILDRFSQCSIFSGVPRIEERRVVLMIEKGMIHFTEENTQSLLDGYSPKATATYLLKHKRDYLKDVDSVEYTTGVALALLKSNLTVGEKSTIIPCFTEDILDGELADEIIQILSKQEVGIKVDFLLNVMRHTRLDRERMIVLNYTLEKNVFDEDVITSFLESLPYPYNHIAEKGRKPVIPGDAESLRLVNVLKNRNYISSYSITKKGIRVNTKLK